MTIGKTSIYEVCTICLNRPGIAFHIKTSHLICSMNHMTSFNMKNNTGLDELS